MSAVLARMSDLAGGICFLQVISLAISLTILVFFMVVFWRMMSALERISAQVPDEIRRLRHDLRKAQDQTGP